MSGLEFEEWFGRFFLLSFDAVLVFINKDFIRERTVIQQD